MERGKEGRQERRMKAEKERAKSGEEDREIEEEGRLERRMEERARDEMGAGREAAGSLRTDCRKCWRSVLKIFKQSLFSH